MVTLFRDALSHGGLCRTGLTCAPARATIRAGDGTTSSHIGRPMSTITLNVNGRAHTLEADPATPLLYILSDELALRGPKFGCGLGQCGACTALVAGKPVRTCVTPASTVGRAEITTLEGLGSVERPHRIQQAFIDEQAAQCGFCLNGVILTAKAFVDQHPRASDAEIAQALSGVLCRCFTHVRMLRAIRRYAQGV
jgi:nicotinate dehydrogenase subunit A